MRVKMIPHWENIKGQSPSGIHTVVDKYFQYLPKVGIELVGPHDEDYDLIAVHAGMARNLPFDCPIVSHIHGLYWTADYQADTWEYKANANVIESLRIAREVTVPSAWVAEPIQRDMHLNPHILPHGIDWWEWTHNSAHEGYVLWNKNRMGDVCDPSPVRDLAMLFPNTPFISTFAPENSPQNIEKIGIVPHLQMREIVQHAAVYLATTKETFGVGILEALASGVPVLGYCHGGAKELVVHGETGYLAEPGNLDDLAEGLNYCLHYRGILGDNARIDAFNYSWLRVADQVRSIYNLALHPRPATVSVVIPCYNKEATLERAVQSALGQTLRPQEIVIVDDGSTDDSAQVAERLVREHPLVRVIHQRNAGVACARNAGVRATTATYVCCLDADDEIDASFLECCVQALERDPSLGLAYTKLYYVDDTQDFVSEWPGEYGYDGFLRRQNQVPTCCVYRRELFDRLGGYRQRYAPLGAGAEDAEFWLRMGAAGYRGKLVSADPLFIYHGGGQTSRSEYREVDWLSWHPWAADHQHPFASCATPAHHSHPVRQYDHPTVSVVIPVGPGHSQYLIDALDSLEAQALRQWEAIVVWDNDESIDEIVTAYPFIRIFFSGSRSAGASRNLGAGFTRAPYLLFLDADDWLHPHALARMVSGLERTNHAIYTDYHVLAHVDDRNALARDIDFVDYNPRTNLSLLRFRSANYDRQRALRQPENPPYVWNTITTLIRKEWHDRIGGFNESLVSWEDVDYWWRMSASGIDFHRITEPLMTYRVHTGERRELGKELWDDLLQTLGENLARQLA